MPELPEMETIKNGLQKKIVGLTISDVVVLNPKSFQYDPKKLNGKKVLKIWRRAKILGVDLVTPKPSLRAVKRSNLSSSLTPEIASAQGPRNDDLVTILIHLKMSGQLIWVGNEKREEKFIGGHPTLDWVGPMPNGSTRVVFAFDDGSHLYFNDQRKFGWIKVVSSKENVVREVLGDFGPEPLEEGFTWEILRLQMIRHKTLSVKVALMDQHVIAGVGNIYANEACFNAKIDPRKKVGDLDEDEWKRLFIGLIKALKDGIKHGGSSRAHFFNADGERGMFLDFANVYSRQGTPCKVCGTEINKITLGGRGTYFCPSCQK